MAKFNLQLSAFCLLCAALPGCTDPTLRQTNSGTPDVMFDNVAPTMSGTPKPASNPGSNPGTTPGTNPGPDPSTTPGTNPGTNPGSGTGPSPQNTTVTILNPLQQMWLAQSTQDLAPNSIPSTYSFRVEVAVNDGTAIATSSDVVWTSSNPTYLTIDRSGYASTSIVPAFEGTVLVTVMASTWSAIPNSTVSASVNLMVGNGGYIGVTVE